MRELQELNFDQIQECSGGYSWYEFGSDIGSAARAAADFAEGFIDHVGRGVDYARDGSPWQ
ncbi:hypothetical protein [Marivirga sp.]|jgi:hypothetical protein|uniref:hypothetical protein n=1 Tax=Marivirga sp. TaxID=2018662 RepID=UPI003DA71E09